MITQKASLSFNNLNKFTQPIKLYKPSHANFMKKNNFEIKIKLNQFNYSRKLNMEFNKKRKRLEEADKQKKENIEEDAYSFDESFELDENGVKRLNLPKKSKYRMRAHCNPLAGVSIA